MAPLERMALAPFKASALLAVACTMWSGAHVIGATAQYIPITNVTADELAYATAVGAVRGVDVSTLGGLGTSTATWPQANGSELRMQTRLGSCLQRLAVQTQCSLSTPSPT